MKQAARRTIAEVSATSSALIDPRLAMKPGQAPSTPPAAGASSARGLMSSMPQQAGGPSREGDDEEALIAAAIDESLKTAQRARPAEGSGHGPTVTPRQAQEAGLETVDDEPVSASAIGEPKKTAQRKPSTSTSPCKTREPEALSDGVAAALARLRDQG